LPQSLSQEPLRAPASFNRLAASTAADIVVLLESGCLVGHNWLEALLSAIHADPSHGLAGPSTNHSWNEQALSHPGIAPATATLADVNRTAQSVRQRFGAAIHYLEPLYSLADFCYAVRREVIDALGAADEAYGLGPCWEMDYNIRAARAGFRGVWACGSYVHRAPFSRRRAAEEARLFDAGKRRYQDKFCALRLRHETSAYEQHCKGDACEHFAPPDLVQIRHSPAANAAAHRVEPVQIRANAPLVSCVMATSNRPAFVLQSIRFFQRQDYPNRELLILDDSTGEDLSLHTAGDERIRYFRLPARLSIGAKRNRGCELARGTFIAQWDDDDWYAPGRLAAQVEPLLSGACQISALSADVFFDLPRWQFWRVSEDLHRRMFVGDVHGGTLVYHRSLFDRGVRYPDRSIAEDAWFLWQATQHGAQVKKIAGADLFIYVRHGTASWEFRCGEFLDPKGWHRVEPPEALAADIAFYQNCSLAGTDNMPHSDQPLVSCIMPTANRRAFVARAIEYFQRQDYPNRELLVLDDGTDLIADLVPEDPCIRYFQLHDRPTLGAKRNLACRWAAGDYILHWDDDDWMSPTRISTQMHALIRHPEVDICGLSQLYFYNPESNQAWLYSHPPGSRAWISGNTLCYRKSLWQGRPFPEINEGEDTLFLWSLSDRQMLALSNPSFFVATVHAGNTSPKRTQTPGWNSINQTVIAAVIGADFGAYRSL
jgi:glycosyltransferase involved in cell wall biosynthesis